MPINTLLAEVEGEGATMSTQRYITIEIQDDTIYLKEEVYGVTLASARLNRITKATFIQFHEFFNSRYRLMPIVVKNENKYLTVVKELTQFNKPIKGSIQKINDVYILLDMSIAVDGLPIKISQDKKILPDIRTLFKSI